MDKIDIYTATFEFLMNSDAIIGGAQGKVFGTWRSCDEVLGGGGIHKLAIVYQMQFDCMQIKRPINTDFDTRVIMKKRLQ